MIKSLAGETFTKLTRKEVEAALPHLQEGRTLKYQISVVNDKLIVFYWKTGCGLRYRFSDFSSRCQSIFNTNNEIDSRYLYTRQLWTAAIHVVYHIEDATYQDRFSLEVQGFFQDRGHCGTVLPWKR